MSEIKASEIQPGQRIIEPGMDEITVVEVSWHGDTVLVTDSAEDQHSFDRDTVVELGGTSQLLRIVLSDTDGTVLDWLMTTREEFDDEVRRNPTGLLAGLHVPAVA
jgi:hypothetical protein